MKKKLFIAGVTVAVVVSLALNLYNFGYLKWKQSIQNQAVSQVIAIIADQATKSGQVKLNMPDRVITLKLDKPRTEEPSNASEIVQ